MPEAGFPARYYIYLSQILEQSGVDVPAMLGKVSLSADLLDTPSTMLRPEQVERLVVAAREATGREDLGLELGKLLKLSSHGVIGYAFLSSPTLDYALRLAAQYFALIIQAFSVRYRSTESGMQVDISPNTRLKPDCLFFHLELLASAFYLEMGDLIDGRAPPYDLYLPYPAPPHRARYRELGDLRCHFNTEGLSGIRFVLPEAMVQRPLRLADPLALKDAENRCREMVRYAATRSEIGDWVGMMLRESTGPAPKLNKVAKALNMSPRTLDRYLRKEGMTYRQLVLKAQHSKACRLLSETELSITEIAYELGFTDVSNFARAFRREADMSPNAWRSRQVAEVE